MVYYTHCDIVPSRSHLSRLPLLVHFYKIMIVDVHPKIYKYYLSSNSRHNILSFLGSEKGLHKEKRLCSIIFCISMLKH
jgi:hypothetical protein